MKICLEVDRNMPLSSCRQASKTVLLFDLLNSDQQYFLHRAEVPASRGQRGARSGGRAASRNGTAGSTQSSRRGREPVQTRSAEEPSPSGMVMIDDDLGMIEEAFPHMGSASSSRPVSMHPNFTT